MMFCSDEHSDIRVFGVKKEMGPGLYIGKKVGGVAFFGVLEWVLSTGFLSFSHGKGRKFLHDSTRYGRCMKGVGEFRKWTFWKWDCDVRPLANERLAQRVRSEIV